ncbi:poly [ADP-ribose] polymerase 1-like [Watersipora subatra]|uniref:poly [ADP-ribose] polymerase 1-like n=1 Tax=Watersipora subatra TaxID=2589382 RepID=UPI00355C7CEF
MSEEFPYKAEYAKSNRASCKSCSNLISKDSLRLAVMVQSRFFDGKQATWFHYGCFWKRAQPVSSTEFAGFDSLRWEDQEKINSKISGGGGASSSSKSKKGATAQDEYSNFSAEYAKSGKSKCRGCEDLISKGEARLAVKDYTSERAVAYGPQSLWHHIDCFNTCRTDVGFTSEMNPDKIPGFKSLSKEDQDEIVSKLGKGDKSKKRKAEPAKDAVDGKKAKVEDAKEAKLLKEQSQAIWKYRDLLEKEVSTNAMKGLLEYNNQNVVNGQSDLLDRLSDCLVFGALSRCPECTDGQLVFKTDAYKCTGNLSEWTRCSYQTGTPKRHAFKVPPEYKDVAFLKTYKYSKRERVIPKATLAASQVNHEALAGITFFPQGSIERNKVAIKALISSMGGKMVYKLDSSVSAVISTKEDVDKMGKKMKEIKDLDIPVLAEGFLEACKEGSPAELVKAYKISDWGKGLEKAFTSVVDAKRPLKSAAVRAAEARAESQFLKEDSGMQKQMVKGGAAVDPDSGLASKAHILQEKGQPLNAVLSMVDIKSGCNSYYKLQVLQHDKQQKYWLFRSWGRIGTTIGGNKVENLGSKHECILKFKELFLEKTGNVFGSKDMVKKANKFFPLEIDYGQDEEEKILALEKESGKTSKLDKAVQELIKLIFDIESMKKAMLEFEIDMKKMPLGKISKKNLTQAYQILTNCHKLLEEKASPARVLDMSNQFFTLIPHDFGMKKPPVLNTTELINAKVEMLDNLKEIECAYNLLKSSAGGEGKDPIDAHYESLKTKIEHVDRESEDFDLINKYTKNTHAKTHSGYTLDVDEVFTIKRAGEKAGYSPFRDLPNRKLLWHGSRLTNFAGILSQGLRIAPPEAPVTGYMFGKGIYFADMVSKSANYCYANHSNPYGLLLLCEVALGNMHELGHAEYVTKLPKGKHSVKGCGRTEPDPNTFHDTKDGVRIPLGPGVDSKPPVPSTSLLYNEYIVYDVSQLNIKYLVKCKFNYKY